MQPVICFYENQQFIYSKDYHYLACPDHFILKEFLDSVEKNYFHNMKILKINFDGFADQANHLSQEHKESFVKTAKADVFILNSFELLSLDELKSRHPMPVIKEPLFTPLITESDFIQSVHSIKKDISQGRFYQINLTAGLRADLGTDATDSMTALEYFFHLSDQIECPYKAYLPLADSQIICLSPELFLKKKKDSVITQPIKGTLVSGDSLVDLKDSHKENAELSMIVDLLRNDLNSISCNQFKDQAKVNFHRKIVDLGYTQHTFSEIEIRSSWTLPAILNKTFPGGSISGCPKTESLIKIAEIENYNRDFYTGSIGWWKESDFTLNIAIRSLLKKDSQFFYFTGCGIVHDSDPKKEWQEFLTKCRFLKLKKSFTSILDTLLWSKGNITYLTEHIERTWMAFQDQKIMCSKDLIESQYFFLQKDLSEKLNKELDYKIRLIFNEAGHFSYEHQEIFPLTEPVSLALCQSYFKPQLYKTIDRRHWDILLQQKPVQAFDVLVVNSQDLVTETSMFNIFYLLNGQFYTPYLDDGCLHGAFRSYHLKKGFITINQENIPLSERSLSINELDKVELYVANSVRGLMKACIVR